MNRFLAMAVTNLSFEQDAPGTKQNNITGWRYISESGRRGANENVADEQAEIVSGSHFDGDQALRLGIKSDNRGACQGGLRRGRQYLVANKGAPMKAPSGFITVWIRNQQWSSPSRHEFNHAFVFNNGVFDNWKGHGQPVAVKEFFKQRWDGSDTDEVKEERQGSDGETWKRYTVEIPGSVEKTSMSFAFRNWMDTWDCNSGWGRATIDAVAFTDSEGVPVEIPSACTVNSVMEPTGLSLPENVAGVPIGEAGCADAALVGLAGLAIGGVVATTREEV